jgi:hypothetical protein
MKLERRGEELLKLKTNLKGGAIQPQPNRRDLGITTLQEEDHWCFRLELKIRQVRRITSYTTTVRKQKRETLAVLGRCRLINRITLREGSLPFMG